MKKFPSIEQFRNVIRDVKTNHDYQGKDESDQPIYNHLTPYPTIRFTGTVKLHGTNAAIIRYKDGRTEFQSRSRVLTLQHDNSQFMLNMVNLNLDSLFQNIEFNDYIAVYGEWCGQGIQKGVGISELSKMFVIFACKVDDEWIDYTNVDLPEGIYNINQFPVFTIDIDFNNPEQVQNKLIELTNDVEAECPVAKHFD